MNYTEGLYTNENEAIPILDRVIEYKYSQMDLRIKGSGIMIWLTVSEG